MWPRLVEVCMPNEFAFHDEAFTRSCREAYTPPVTSTRRPARVSIATLSFVVFSFVEHLQEPHVDLLDGVAHAFHPAARVSLRQAPVRLCRCRRSAATGAPVSPTTPLMLERRKRRSIGGDLHRLFPDTLIDERPPLVLRVPWRAAR